MLVRMTDPFAALLSVHRALDSAERADWLGTVTAGAAAFPPINVFRDGHDFAVVAELPGVKKEDLDVQVKGNEVRIRGSKTIRYDDDVSVRRRERASARFDRTVRLPAHIDAANVSAEYRDGVLTVRLPVAESDKPHAVIIN